MDLRAAARRELGAFRDPASVIACGIDTDEKALRLNSQRLLFIRGGILVHPTALSIGNNRPRRGLVDRFPIAQNRRL
jgi:hypothetical protein